MYGDFTARNTVRTPYIPIHVWFWPTLEVQQVLPRPQANLLPRALALHVLASCLDSCSRGLGFQRVVLLVELTLCVHLQIQMHAHCHSQLAIAVDVVLSALKAWNHEPASSVCVCVFKCV